ncbi:MAG: TetR/AcrR family transcriptional repressor of nem operon, partial [Vicingaceae bacterium]
FDKEEVLNKAMKLFWEKGYYATSMENLVSTLGINRASLYTTFGSKYDLFEQALDKYNSTNSARIADYLYYQLNVRKGLQLLFENLITEALLGGCSKGCFMVNTTTELANFNPVLDKKLQDSRLNLETVFYNYLKYGVDNGQISPYKDMKTIAAYLFTVQSGLYVNSKINSSKEELGKTVTAALSILD